VSLVNLSLSCYPDRLEYVGQVLGFAQMKVQEYADSSDLHHSQTTQNLLALLLAPINTYTNILTLFALPNYQELLRAQPYSTRKAIAHAVVGSVLKNDTIISTPEDVKAVLDLCHVLVKDQRDAGVGMPSGHPGMARGYSSGGRQPQASQIDMEEAAEEQGWLARMVHLFKSDDLDQQFAVGRFRISQLTLMKSWLCYSYYKQLAKNSQKAATGYDGLSLL